MKSNKLFHTVMKVKNIIYIISLVFAAMSCSMDSDTMMNDTTKEIENSLNNGEVAVSFSLTDGSVATKSVTPAAADNTTDQDINNVTVFLLKNDAVIDVMTSSTGNTAYNNCFYVKNEGSMELIVVANASTLGVNYENSESILKAAANLSDCTKWARHTIDFSKAENKSYHAAIELSQSYAKIELAEFNVRKASGNYNDVEVGLDKVEIKNINSKGVVDGSLVESPELGNEKQDCMYTIIPTTNESKNIVANSLKFNTFANAGQMVMILTYHVGKVSKTHEIVIEGNEGMINAGNIYKIKVNATLRAEQLDFDVVFDILNWIDGGTLIDGDLTIQK